MPRMIKTIMNVATIIQTTRGHDGQCPHRRSRLLLILPGQSTHPLDDLPALLADRQRIEKIGRIAARLYKRLWIELPATISASIVGI